MRKKVPSLPLIGLLLAVTLTPQPVHPEEVPDVLQQRQERLNQILAGARATDSGTPGAQVVDPARPGPLPGAVSDPNTRRLYEKAMQDYYAYRSQGLGHRSAVFAWQLFSAKLIFVVVLVLVGCGIVFAAVQFRQGMQRPGKSEVATGVELSAKGIKLNSPVLGVIILFLSLGFFYLYLVYVYPVENIF